MLSLWKTCLLGALAAIVLPFTSARADVRIQGAGATFPAPLYAKWVETYKKLHPDITIDYQPVGSGAGIKAITDRTVQFGASDAPLTDNQLKAAPARLLHIPTVAGPAVMIYNVPGVAGLKLSGAVIADIYLHTITDWNDAKIAALNPGVNVPAMPISVVHRSDGSGTSYIFTDYLSKASTNWKSKVGKGTAVQWPTGVGGPGNPGVATAVKNAEGGIGYVELAYAVKEKLPFATLVNKDGKEVTASIDSVNAASAAALKEFPDDFRVSITDAPGPQSYPICGYTYLLVYEDLSYMKDKTAATELVNFFKWCETDGQELAADLGYAKLPGDAQGKVIERLKSIKFDGESLLK